MDESRGEESIGKAAEVQAGSGFTVDALIINASSADLTLTSAPLYDGQWQGGAPVAGWELAASQQAVFTNVSNSVFGPLGANLSFTPASGGTVSMTWAWHPGTPLVAYGTASSSTLTLSFNVANDSTTHARITYVISESGAAAWAGAE